MVSKASEDLPEPESPVITTSLSRGISMSTFLRLCSRAPRTRIWSFGIRTADYRTSVRSGGQGLLRPGHHQRDRRLLAGPDLEGGGALVDQHRQPAESVPGHC